MFQGGAHQSATHSMGTPCSSHALVAVSWAYIGHSRLTNIVHAIWANRLCNLMRAADQNKGTLDMAPVNIITQHIFCRATNGSVWRARSTWRLSRSSAWQSRTSGPIA